MNNRIQNIHKLKGVGLDISAGAGTEETTYEPVASEGDIIGICCSENYDRADLSQVLCTMEQGSYKPIEDVPLTTLIINDERVFQDVNFKKTGKIKITLVSSSANTLAANKPVLTFFFCKTGKLLNNEKPRLSFLR